MHAERYTITIFGIDAKYYTDEYISHIWKTCTENEYQKGRQFITGLVDKRSLVCGTIRGCELAEYAHIITVVRNPVEFSDTDTFWNSLKNVLKELRVSLGNPSMTIAKQQIEYYYFK